MISISLDRDGEQVDGEQSFIIQSSGCWVLFFLYWEYSLTQSTSELVLLITHRGNAAGRLVGVMATGMRQILFI